MDLVLAVVLAVANPGFKVLGGEEALVTREDNERASRGCRCSTL
jgi:hypothetical protein